MNDRDANNLEFIRYTLDQKGPREFNAWFEIQEDYIQEDVLRLLNYHNIELSDSLVETRRDCLQARTILSKFTLSKI